MEKKLESNYTRMLRAILNKSWRQHPTKQQLYGHLPPITKTVHIRLTRHAGHCWRSKDEHISDVLLWIPSHGRAKAGRLAQTYIQQLCADTECIPEDLPEAMIGRGSERGSGISVLIARHDDEATGQGEGKLNSNLLNLAWKLTLCRILLERKGWWVYISHLPNHHSKTSKIY